MRSLFRYLLKNYGFFLFLLLEVFSLIMIFNYNSYQKVKFLNSSGRLTASVYNTYNSIVYYFSLSKINKELAEENARLKTMYKSIPEQNILQDSFPILHSDEDSVYKYIPARIINNSVNKPFNYITLNKGSKDGIKPDQGIISTGGIVGVITNVSESYSVGMSVLNQRWTVSVKLKKSGFFGSLAWDGRDYGFANLTEIPFHVELADGDTIVTSGYSTIFPEGILVGTIQAYEQPEGENYYNIKVKLSTNFKTISFVNAVENLKKDEIENLEKMMQDDKRTN